MWDPILHRVLEPSCIQLLSSYCLKFSMMSLPETSSDAKIFANPGWGKATTSWFLELRIKRCTQKTSGRKKNYSAASLLLLGLQTAENPLLKNPPFKESTDDSLLYLYAENFCELVRFPKISGTHFNPAFQLARALSLMEIDENFLHMNCLWASFWKISPSIVKSGYFIHLHGGTLVIWSRFTLIGA